MSAFAIIILIFLIISALLLIGLVLMQDDAGEGLAGLIGGGSQQAGGPRSATFVTRLTSLLAAIFVISALALAWLNRTPDIDNVEQAARALEAQDAPLEWWQTNESPDAASNFLEQLTQNASDASIDTLDTLLQQIQDTNEEIGGTINSESGAENTTENTNETEGDLE